MKKSEELVPGDIVILEAGDAVPADGRILESASMKIEEAALTGESVPVNKTADVLNAGAASEVPLGDRKNMVYMGSTVVYGRGRAVITGTGMKTEMGKIAHVLTQSADESTPLQKRLNQLSKILSVMVLAICAVIFVVGILKEGVTPQNILNSFMVAVSLAVAAIPEGLAAVVTIVLSIGVTKMSKRNAVIRKLTAVETLGCTQVICSDKTGTLTQDKVNVYIICLVMGVLFTELGFLPRNALSKLDSYFLLLFSILMTIFSSLAKVTPQTLVQSFIPVLVVLLLGAAGVVVFAFLLSKVLKQSAWLNIALGITCTFGFPTTVMLSEEIANGVGTTDEEKSALRNYLLPQMTVAGFITVTIGSVILAGIIVPLLG